MTSWSIDFSPLVPHWLLYTLAVAALAVAAALIWRGAARRLAPVARLRPGASGLCDPRLVQENRRPLKDIVAIVVDRSESNTIAGRASQSDKARDEVEARLKALGDVDMRVVETSREESRHRRDAAVRGAARRARRRAARAGRRRDRDHRRRRPRHSRLVRRARVQRAVARPDYRARGRAPAPDRADRGPRYGIVGKDQTIAARILDSADIASRSS